MHNVMDNIYTLVPETCTFDSQVAHTEFYANYIGRCSKVLKGDKALSIFYKLVIYNVCLVFLILFRFVPETVSEMSLCLSADLYILCLKAAILADYACGRISDTVCWRLGNPCEIRRRTPHTANKSIVKR